MCEWRTHPGRGNRTFVTFVVPQLENGEERIRDGGHTSDIVDSQAVSGACLVLGRDGEVADVRAAVLASVDSGDRLVGESLVDERKSGLLTMWNDAPLSIVRLRTRPGAMLSSPIGPVVRSEHGAGNCGSSVE